MPGGGPGGMRGGPGGWGGMRGGGPGGGPAGFLARMDANGNGMLDPEESQGPARMFLDRIASEAKLDLSRPIPLDRVTKAFEEMRNRRRDMRGGPGEDGGRGGPEGGSSSSSDSDVQPLVPGFGEPDLFDPVPGFGELGERFAVKIDDEDRKEALRTMGRSDRNRDGVLDADEIRAGSWGEDPMETDRNRDGKLTLNELALRYAIRRTEESGGNSGRGRTASRGRNSSSPGGSQRSSDQNDRQNRMVEMIFQRYDSNRSGTLEKDEWGQFRSDPSGYDSNHDGKITRQEFAAGMAGRFGGRGGNGGDQGRWFARRGGGGNDQGGASDSTSSGSPASPGGRKSYRSPSPTQRLASIEGLPEWFARSDTDGDGQVQMSEYASSWSEQVVADFAQFDINGDGIVTPKECMKAKEAGAVQGIVSAAQSSDNGGNYGSDRSPGRGSRARRSSSSSSRTKPVSASAPAGTASNEPAHSSPAPARTDVSSKYLKYAVAVIQRYDNNRNSVLEADEWSKMSSDCSGADVDKDGRITPVELAGFYSNQK